MKLKLQLCLIGSLLLAGTVVLNAQIKITEAMSSSGTGGTADWFELTNIGSTGTFVHDFIPTNTTLTAHNSTGIAFDYDNKARTLMPIMGAFELGLPIEVWIGGVLQMRYKTLKAAFDAVNNGTHTGDLEIRVTDSTDETASAVLNASGTGSANYSSIVIFPTLSGLSITGTLTSPLIDFNGADNVTIDGRVNRTGANKDLTIVNLQAFSTAATVRFYNDASNNTIKYCTLQGVSLSSGTQGIITFAGGSVTGNINNIISSNNITGISDSKRHILGIYSVGSSATVTNKNLIISNNNFYNLFHKGGDSWNIYFGDYTTDCAITNNSFYETSAFSPTSNAKYTSVYISNTSGVNFTVTDNFIGGNAPQCSGGLNVNSTYSNSFYGIYMNIGTTQTSNIQGNTINNLTWRSTGSTASYWVGIMLERGNANVGTTVGNIIGSDTGTGAINIQFGGNNSEVYAYSLLAWGTGSLNCQNNKVGGLTIENSNSTYATNFYGMIAGNGRVSISNNLIGSLTATSSIHLTSQSTSNAQKMYGILLYSNVRDAQITNNTIANLTNSTDNPTTSTAGFIHGIASSAEVSQISTNTIHNLSVASGNKTSGSTASAIGIVLASTNSNNTVLANTIYNLSNTFLSFQGSIYGILFNGNLSENTVSRNFIHSLTTKNSAGANIIGIYAQTGNTTYANNIINIGDSSLVRFSGIYDVGTASQTCKFYHNSVYIGGISTLEAANSYALFSNASNNVRDYRNNIFYNARYNSGVNDTHYAAYFNYASPGSLTLDNNNYYVSGGSGSVLGYYASADKTSLPLIPGYDTYSHTTNPGFINPGGVNATDYQLNGVKPLAATGTGITVDYSNATRPTNPTSGAWEYDIPNLWKGNISPDWGNRYNWTNGAVPASGADVTFDPVPTNHAVLDQDRIIGSLNNAQSTYRAVINGKKLTINGALNLTNGAQIDASASNSTLEFAGNTVSQYIQSGNLYEGKVYNLNVKNPNNLVLTGTLRLLNSLSSESGVLDATTNAPTLVFGGSTQQNPNGATLLSGRAYNVTIDNSAGAVLTGDMAVDNNLTLQQGDISTGNYKLTLQGNTIGNGGYITTNANAGTIEYAGTSVQTIRMIKDNTANALLITNTSLEGATIIGNDNSFGDLNTFNSISIGSGSTLNVEAGDKLTVNNNLTNEGTFRLLSNSDGTATLLTNGSVSANEGTYKVQQYLTGSNNGSAPDGRFWYVSSPLSGALSGTFNPASGLNKLWSWDEPTHSYINILNNTDMLSVGKGYVARMGNTGTVEFSSSVINNGNLTLNVLSWTGQTHINRGYNLIGNPYPSYLNWKDVWVDPNTGDLRMSGLPYRMRATIWVRSANSTLYTYNPVSGTYATTNPQPGEIEEPNIQYIAPMQAFWVETFDPEMNDGSISFNNSYRTHQLTTDHRLRAKAAPNTEKKELRLSITDGTNTDQTVVQFNPKASDTYDLYDSHKMSFSGIPQVYTKVGKEVLSINGMGSFTNERIVPLGYSVPQAGTYTLKASEISNFGSGTQVLLVDNATLSVTDLTLEDTYEFTSDKVDNYNRFTIILRTPGTVTEIPQNEQRSIVVFRNGDNKITVICNEELQFNASVTIYNAAGQAMYNKALSGRVTVVDKEFTPGVYIARVDNGEKIVSAKVIVE